jgi:hypothetical protein
VDIGRRLLSAGGNPQPRRAERQAALTAATSFISESLASPNSMTVLGS